MTRRIELGPHSMEFGADGICVTTLVGVLELVQNRKSDRADKEQCAADCQQQSSDRTPHLTVQSHGWVRTIAVSQEMSMAESVALSA